MLSKIHLLSICVTFWAWSKSKLTIVHCITVIPALHLNYVYIIIPGSTFSERSSFIVGISIMPLTIFITIINVIIFYLIKVQFWNMYGKKSLLRFHNFTILSMMWQLNLISNRALNDHGITWLIGYHNHQ